MLVQIFWAHQECVLMFHIICVVGEGLFEVGVCLHGDRKKGHGSCTSPRAKEQHSLSYIFHKPKECKSILMALYLKKE